MTTQHNAYRTGYKREDVRHHAWRSVENSCGYLIERLEQGARTVPDLAILDCGCGPGSITSSMAKYLPVGGSITAVDLSTEVLSQARSLAEERDVADRITFVQGSIYELGALHRQFDIVHANMVITHLDDPVDAIRNMLAVCKPGGTVALCESTRGWQFNPPDESLTATVELWAKYMHVIGGDADAGMRLVSHAIAAGAAREDITVSSGTWCYATPDGRAMWGTVLRDRLRAGTMRDKILSMQDHFQYTAQDLDRLCDAWEQWMEDEEGVCTVMLGQILITRR
ncbi:hypothetical protein PYCC9005_005218 [Savitreella phatthalungensis]